MPKAIGGDGVEYRVVLARGNRKADPALRMARGDAPQQVREIVAEVTALPQENRYQRDITTAGGAQIGDRSVQVRPHEFEKGQDYAGVRRRAADALAQPFERLGPAGIAGPMGEQD